MKDVASRATFASMTIVRDRLYYTGWVLVERDADATEDLWVSHCLDFDVVSQGDTPAQAVESAIEAVTMLVLEDLEAGRDPHDRPRAPSEEWTRLFNIMRHGKTVKVADVDPKARLVLVTQLVLAVERVEHHIEVESPAPLHELGSFIQETAAA